VLGFPTGNTPEGMYELLVKYHQKGLVDFSTVTAFNLDEYYPLEELRGESFREYMQKHLYEKANFKKERTFIPDGNILREQIEDHCREYDQKIKEAGGIDIQVLGLGVNGHIGFNEPGSEFSEGTRLVKLKERTRERNFEEIRRAPEEAISMGVKTVMQSRKVVLLASDEEKSKPLQESVNGKISEQWPCSVLQLHPDVLCLVDQLFFSGLQYRIFGHIWLSF